MTGVSSRTTSAAFLLLIAAYLTSGISDPSFYFHLALGQWILGHGAFPHVDSWTLLGEGKPWLAGSWLFDVSLALCEDLFGVRGFALLSFLGSAAFVLSLGGLFCFLTGAAATGTLVAVMVACGCLERAELSPDLFAWAVLALACQYCLRPLSAFRRNSGLLICGALLANLHPAFLLLPFFVAFLHPGNASQRAISTGIVVISALLSPYLGAQAVQSLVFASREAEIMIRFQQSGATAFLFSFAFLLLLWILFLLLLPRDRRFGENRLILFAGMLSFAGFLQRELLPYALIAAGILVAKSLARSFTDAADGSEPVPLIEALRRLVTGLARVPAAGGLWIIFCLFVVNLFSILKNPLIERFLPRQAVDTLLEQNYSGPLLHERNIGPYLVYRFSRLAPERKLLAAADERLPYFSPQLANAEHALRALHPGWEQYFEAIHPETVLCRKGTALFEILSASSSWKLAYQDGVDMPDKGDVEVSLPPKTPPAFGWALFQRV